MKCYFSILHIEVPHKSDKKQWFTTKFYNTEKQQVLLELWEDKTRPCM